MITTEYTLVISSLKLEENLLIQGVVTYLHQQGFIPTIIISNGYSVCVGNKIKNENLRHYCVLNNIKTNEEEIVQVTRENKEMCESVNDFSYPFVDDEYATGCITSGLAFDYADKFLKQPIFGIQTFPDNLNDFCYPEKCDYLRSVKFSRLAFGKCKWDDKFILDIPYDINSSNLFDVGENAINSKFDKFLEAVIYLKR